MEPYVRGCSGAKAVGVSASGAAQRVSGDGARFHLVLHFPVGQDSCMSNMPMPIGPIIEVLPANYEVNGWNHENYFHTPPNPEAPHRGRRWSARHEFRCCAPPIGCHERCNASEWQSARHGSRRGLER